MVPMKLPKHEYSYKWNNFRCSCWLWECNTSRGLHQRQFFFRKTFGAFVSPGSILLKPSTFAPPTTLSSSGSAAAWTSSTRTSSHNRCQVRTWETFVFSSTKRISTGSRLNPASTVFWTHKTRLPETPSSLIFSHQESLISLYFLHSCSFFTHKLNLEATTLGHSGE